MIDTFIFL